MAFIKNLIKAIKQKFPLIIICLLIVITCLYTTFQHYTNAGKSDLLADLETFLYDKRLKLRGIEQPKAKVGILAIDEKSIARFGSWPFSRKYYKKAMLNLKKLGVKWIGYDVVFSEPEPAKLIDIKKELSELENSKNNKNAVLNTLNRFNKYKEFSLGDRQLAKGVAEFENVVLGYFYFQSKGEVERAGREKNPYHGLEQMTDSSIMAVVLPDGKELKDYPDFLKSYGLAANIPIVSEAGSHFAFFSNEADDDAIVRWVTLVRIIDGNLMPSLSLKTAAEFLNRDILVIFDEHGIESIELVNREDESDSLSIPIDPYGQGRALAKYRGPSRIFRHISMADAYDMDFDEETKEFLKDSVLLAGMTAIGINDQRPTPFDPAVDGVENHATVIDNVLSKDFMKRPKSIFNIELLILLAIGLIFSPLLIFSRASFAGIAVGLFLIGYYYFDKYYWFNNGIWAYMGMPFVEIFALFISITLYKYIVEEREKKKVKGAFAHYLSPDVINQVLDDPESLQLGGVRKELTVFFSDVRSFTTISESLSPEQLCVFMNDYFTPMTGIILREKGVLDKYIGDAIMAFWGAPIPLVDQADIAADSSIEMLYALDKLQIQFAEKGFPRCEIGIGLNTGSMSVGNMGSDERFCYTVMGDAVNLASRLEGLTKEYGIKILISEFTVAKFTKNHHLVRDLDDIRVKGKNEPIKVFELMRPDLLSNEQLIRDLIGNFEEGRKLYQAQEWEKAEKFFKECQNIHAEDGPSKVYLSRVLDYKQKPKIENWDGVYTFTHK